jgi:hypothetical protein
MDMMTVDLTPIPNQGGTADHIHISQEAELTLGIRPGSLDGPASGWFDVLHPFDRDRYSACLDTVLEQRRGRIHLEFRLRGDGVGLRGGQQVLGVLEIAEVGDLALIELGLAGEFLGRLDLGRLSLQQLGLGVFNGGDVGRGIDLKKEVTFFDALVITNRNLDDRPGHSAGDSHHIGAHLAVTRPGLGRVAFIHAQGSGGRQKDCHKREDVF